MINRVSILILFVFGLSLAVLPQGIVFEEDYVDVGDVKNWGLQPAVYHFTNLSDQKAFILKMGDHPDLRIVYPKKYIHPGERDSILVYFIPEEVSAFIAHVDVWTSDREEPQVLTMVGRTLSMDECPGTPASPTSPERLVRVVEKGTGNPVPGAKVMLERSRQNRFRDYTNRRGEYTRDLEPGKYSARVEHKEYLPREEEFKVDEHTRIIVIMIEPFTPDEEPEPELAENHPVEDIPAPLTEIPQPRTLDVEADEVPPFDTLIPYPGTENEDELLLPWADYKQSNIIFLVDISSSMRSKDKLPLLKASISQLIAVLRSVDNVSLIVFANETSVLIDGATGAEKDLLNMSLDSLVAKGKTYGIKGLNKAYDVAQANYIPGGNNLVIVATDGEFNSPDYSPIELSNLVRKNSRDGISTSVIGFGQGTWAQIRMRQIAASGKGSYMHIDTDSDPEDVDDILVDEIKERSHRQ